MTPGEAYCQGTLVRVVAPDFVAGFVIHPETGRAIITAPILGFLRGQPADKLRQTFHRLGWKATIVKREGNNEQARLGTKEPQRSEP